MNRNHKPHSEEIVKRFQESLSKKARKHIKDSAYAELAVTIESAISTAVMQGIEEVADHLDDYSRKLRKQVENFGS